MTSARWIEREHFGSDAHSDGHRDLGQFDYFCVAHGADYAPKYLEGEVCHNGMGDGFCHDGCRRCPRRCPFRPCPIIPDDDFEDQPALRDEGETT